MSKPKPLMEIYYGQSLAPPGIIGLSARGALWVRMNGEWYRIEHTTSITKIVNSLKRLYMLRKWPWGGSDE